MFGLFFRHYVQRNWVKGSETRISVVGLIILRRSLNSLISNVVTIVPLIYDKDDAKSIDSNKACRDMDWRATLISFARWQ